MNYNTPAYGLWSLVIINSVVSSKKAMFRPSVCKLGTNGATIRPPSDLNVGDEKKLLTFQLLEDA